MLKPLSGKLVNREMGEYEKGKLQEQTSKIPILNINEALAKDVKNIAKGIVRKYFCAIKKVLGDYSNH